MTRKISFGKRTPISIGRGNGLEALARFEKQARAKQPKELTKKVYSYGCTSHPSLHGACVMVEAHSEDEADDLLAEVLSDNWELLNELDGEWALKPVPAGRR